MQNMKKIVQQVHVGNNQTYCLRPCYILIVYILLTIDVVIEFDFQNSKDETFFSDF